MKKMIKSAVVALTLALSLSLGAGVTANAAKVTVKKVTSVNKLTGKKTITLTKGKKATLKTTVTVTPNKSKNKKVTYTSKNSKIASVTSKGVIKAKKVGSTKITVTTAKKNKKGKKLTAKVTVKVVAGKVTKVSVDKTAVTLTAGATDTVTATVKTKGKKANKTLVWTSSDKNVATVDNKGVITAVAAGSATITAKSTDGTNKKATVAVTVNAQTTTLALAKDKDVVATVEFSDVKKVLDDFNNIVKAAGLKDDAKVSIILDDNKTATEKTVKEARDYITAHKDTTKKASVKLTIKAAEAAKYGLAGALFAPASVKSVTIDGVKFESITATSFKIGTKEYKYTASGKNVVVEGHVKADFAKVTAITATEN